LPLGSHLSEEAPSLVRASRASDLRAASRRKHLRHDQVLQMLLDLRVLIQEQRSHRLTEVSPAIRKVTVLCCPHRMNLAQARASFPTYGPSRVAQDQHKHSNRHRQAAKKESDLQYAGPIRFCRERQAVSGVSAISLVDCHRMRRRTLHRPGCLSIITIREKKGVAHGIRIKACQG
jgi:hypothetical protein